MRIALVQQHATANRAENLKRGVEAVRKAAVEAVCDPCPLSSRAEKKSPS